MYHICLKIFTEIIFWLSQYETKEVIHLEIWNNIMHFRTMFSLFFLNFILSFFIFLFLMIIISFPFSTRVAETGVGTAETKTYLIDTEAEFSNLLYWHSIWISSNKSINQISPVMQPQPYEPFYIFISFYGMYNWLVFGRCNACDFSPFLVFNRREHLMIVYDSLVKIWSWFDNHAHLLIFGCFVLLEWKMKGCISYKTVYI